MNLEKQMKRWDWELSESDGWTGWYIRICKCIAATDSNHPFSNDSKIIPIDAPAIPRKPFFAKVFAGDSWYRVSYIKLALRLFRFDDLPEFFNVRLGLAKESLLLLKSDTMSVVVAPMREQ